MIARVGLSCVAITLACSAERAPDPAACTAALARIDSRQHSPGTEYDKADLKLAERVCPDAKRAQVRTAAELIRGKEASESWRF